MEMEGEALLAVEGNHETGDLDDFFPTFGVHQRRGRHGLEARGAIGPPLASRDPPPVGLHAKTTPRRGWTGAERKTRVVLPL